MFGEAKETCLVNPLPSGARLHWPIHARDRKTLDMYAMLEKKITIPFSQEILKDVLCNKMQVNVKGVFTISYVLCHDIVNTGC